MNSGNQCKKQREKRLRENDLQHPFSTPSRVEGKRLSERREMKGERIKALVDIMAESL